MRKHHPSYQKKPVNHNEQPQDKKKKKKKSVHVLSEHTEVLKDTKPVEEASLALMTDSISVKEEKSQAQMLQQENMTTPEDAAVIQNVDSNREEKLLLYYETLHQNVKEVLSEKVTHESSKAQQNEDEIKNKIENKIENNYWDNIHTREEFIIAFQKLHALFPDAENFLNEFQTTLEGVEIEKLMQWITNSDKPMFEQFLQEKNNYPEDEKSRNIILIAVQQVYYKLREKQPEIKSYSGTAFSFLFEMNKEYPLGVHIYSGSFKLKGVRQVQLAILKNGLSGLEEMWNNPQSSLAKYIPALTEERSDVKKFTDQVLQFTTISFDHKKEQEKHFAVKIAN